MKFVLPIAFLALACLLVFWLFVAAKEAAMPTPAPYQTQRMCVVYLPDIEAIMRQRSPMEPHGPMTRKALWFPCVHVHGWQDA